MSCPRGEDPNLGRFPGVRVQAPTDTTPLRIWAGGLSSATTSHLSGWYVRLGPSWTYIGLICRIGVADCLYEVAECSDDDGDLVSAHPGLTGHGPNLGLRGYLLGLGLGDPGADHSRVVTVSDENFRRG